MFKEFVQGKLKTEGFLKRQLKFDRGSFTVEAALVFPIVILVLAGLILAMLLMYQKVLLTKIAGDAVCQAVSFRSEGLYARLMPQNNISGEETISEVLEKKESLEDKCSVLLEELLTKSLGYSEREFKKIQVVVYQGLKREIIRPQETIVTVKFRQSMLKREISINIIQEMKIIFGTIKLTGAAKASGTEAAEFIRNIDLASEYAQRVKRGLSKNFPDFGSRDVAGTETGED